MIVWSVVWMIVILLIAVSYIIYLVLNFDKNFWSLYLIENRSQYPHRGASFYSVRSLRSLPLRCAMLCNPALTSGRGERARSASGSRSYCKWFSTSEAICLPVNVLSTTCWQQRWAVQYYVHTQANDMRLIEQQMCSAVINKNDWRKDNTEVMYSPSRDVCCVYLHKNLIATAVSPSPPLPRASPTAPSARSLHPEPSPTGEMGFLVWQLVFIISLTIFLTHMHARVVIFILQPLR